MVAAEEEGKTMGGKSTYTVLEQLEISDDEDGDEQYEEIPDDIPDGDDGMEEDALDDLNRLLAETKGPKQLDGDGEAREGAAGAMASTKKRPEVVDDFIRNFLLKHGLKRSLDAFQTEWYELQASGLLQGQEVTVVPDLAMENRHLEEENAHIKNDFIRVKAVAE